MEGNKMSTLSMELATNQATSMQDIPSHSDLIIQSAIHSKETSTKGMESLVEDMDAIDCIEGDQLSANPDRVRDERDPLSELEQMKAETASADSEDSALGGSVCVGVGPGADRGEGSDSGLGFDTADPARAPLLCTLQPTPPSTSNTHFFSEIVNYSDLEVDRAPSLRSDQSPIASIETDATTLCEVVTCDLERASVSMPQRSNLKRKTGDEEGPRVKRTKKSIRFDSVTVFYFPRAQGFTCVPSAGGSTLGMERRHSHAQRFTLPEHAAEQRRLHRQLLQQLRSERLQRPPRTHTHPHSSSDDTDSDSDTADLSDSELELDGYYFLQPVGARARRALLRAAGVRKVEPHEKDECRDIRASREFCGCACQDFCDPETCSCSLAGIKCQVDRLSFPCGCSRDACANSTGRVEFNPLRVQTHFVHTLVRLGLERGAAPDASARRWPPPPPSLPAPAAAAAHTYSASSFEEFAHPTHISMFNHYAYPPEPSLPALACSDAPQNDHNWYSPGVAPAAAAVAAGGGGDADGDIDTDAAHINESDNFGEIIKKTLVDSVSCSVTME